MTKKKQKVKVPKIDGSIQPMKPEFTKGAKKKTTKKVSKKK